MNTRQWRWTLALAVTISVAGNVGYALMTATPAHAVIAALAAAVAPTMLFLITHNLAGDRGGARDWRNTVSLAGAWAITLMAFAASYIELHALMLLLGRSPASAILTPLIVDVAIAVASVRVLASDEPAAGQARKPGRLAKLADAAVARAEATLAVPVEGAVEGPAEVATEESVESAEGSVETPHASAKPTVKRSAKVATKPAVDPALEPFMDQARELAEQGLVRGKSAEDYGRILLALDRSWSPTRIKRELGIAPSTTEKVREAAGQRRVELAAV